MYSYKFMILRYIYKYHKFVTVDHLNGNYMWSYVHIGCYTTIMLVESMLIFQMQKL